MYDVQDSMLLSCALQHSSVSSQSTLACCLLSYQFVLLIVEYGWPWGIGYFTSWTKHENFNIHLKKLADLMCISCSMIIDVMCANQGRWTGDKLVRTVEVHFMVFQCW